MLTHTREKLRFVEKSNSVVKSELEDVEGQILDMRAVLNVSKRERDGVKGENKELRRKQGFASSDLLLVDFESRRASFDIMAAEIMDLKSRYQVLAQQAGVKNSYVTMAAMAVNNATAVPGTAVGGKGGGGGGAGGMGDVGGGGGGVSGKGLSMKDSAVAVMDSRRPKPSY